jgi:hypothetical protein
MSQPSPSNERDEALRSLAKLIADAICAEQGLSPSTGTAASTGTAEDPRDLTAAQAPQGESND